MIRSAWLVLLLGACSSDPALQTDGGPPDAAPPQIQFTVQLIDARAATLTPLPGIEVCAADRPDIECALSDADGRVSLSLPANSELMLRCRSESYGPAYMTWALGTEDVDAGQFSLLEASTQTFFIVLSGAAQWPDRGALTANVYTELERRDTRIEGATLTIEPAAGGPTYVSEARMPDPALGATSLGGPALFYDIEPGEVTVTIHHPTLDCRGGFGWPAQSPQSLRSRVFAGGLSNVTFVCTP